MNTVARKLAYFMLGLGLPLATLQPAYADDIEIFSVGAAVTPKILMILDTSLSMADPVSNNENRLTHMKRAMKSFIESAEGVHVGIMRFNTRTGAMVYPVSNLTEQITETISSLNRPLTANKNHAYQSKTGNLNIETVDWRSSMSLSDEGKIGMRFTNIVIPKGHVITKAYLELIPTSSRCQSYTFNEYYRYWTTDYNCKINFTVHGDKTLDSVDFYTKDISSRPPTTNIKAHQITTWQQGVSNKTSVVVNGLAPIIKEIIDQNGWEKGNALSLIIDTKRTDNNLSTEKFKIHNVISGFAPTLFIEFTPYERTISVKDKMLEALENQKMTNYTPIVPALFEAVKYFQGANIDSPHNAGISRTRSAPTNDMIINKLHERIAHPQSFNNGSTLYPPGCNAGNLNSAQCRNISIESSAKYISPLTGTCNDDEAAIVLLTDGDATLYNGGTWWQNMRTDIRSLTGGSCTTNPSAQACGIRLATKMAEGVLVNGATKKISLHTIGFNTANDFLDDLAQQGETAPVVPSRYHSATNSDQLLDVFNEIKNSVLTDTSTFANSSASVSTSNRLRHNGTLYFALFAPGEQSSWAGNLKRYQLHANGEIYDNSSPQQSATDSTGKFIDSAKSFWSTTPDGSNVAQGGAAEVLSNRSSRNIYINTGTTNTLTLLANTTTVKDVLTPSVFNVSNTTEAQSLIEWMLANKTIADPLHSTPTEISYANDDSVIFFGDNQGYLHAIDSETGTELYAFMPKQLLSNQKLIKANLASANGNHIYGMDGEIVKWQKSNGTKYIYSGMRRGGSSYYALDVTDRSTPTLKWQIHNTGDFSGLGQTWSKPVKTKIVFGSTTHDVLIFGGGYDPAQDNSTTRTSDSKGVGVYIVDADSGSLLWSATAANSSKSAMKYSFPSDVKAIDIDGDGAVDQIYVGDMGGQLWRFDVTNKNSNNPITYGVIANIATDASAASNRRFYHAPDVSVMKGRGGQVLAVAIGSGYRAHPNNGVIQDNFYMFKQPLKIEGRYPSPIVQSDLFDATSNTIGQGSEAAVNVATSELNNADGWFVTLNGGGEKVLASSLTVDHAIWFTTFQPSLTTAGCADRKGTSRLYRVRVSDATPDYLKVVPQDPNKAKLDSANNCGSVSCNSTDRSMTLRNTTLPPRPALLNIGGKRLIGVGSEYYPALNNKTTNMYWSNSQ